MTAIAAACVFASLAAVVAFFQLRLERTVSLPVAIALFGSSLVVAIR